MSVVPIGTFSGRFVSTGNSQFIPLPQGADWMWVKNETVSYAAGAGTGAEFYWAKGDTQGQGTIYAKTVATNALQVGQIAALAGFFLQNTTLNVPGALTALTGITNGNPPVVNVGGGGTAGLVALTSIVRIYSTVGAQQVRGLDFTVGAIVPNTSFTLAYMAQIANANPGAGTFRIIPFNPYFYPNNRYITKAITNPANAATTIVTLSVTHTFVPGQKVRFIVPTVTAAAYGMTQLDGLTATIVAVGAADADGITNTITVDIDSSGFTAFAFPLTAAPGFTPAQVVPYGENTAEALNLGTNLLADSVSNIGQTGMLLMAGTSSPAGAIGDVITWVAGKSFNQ